MKLLLMTSLENVSLEWCKTFHSLEHYKINRCYKSNGFGKVKQISLHHFSDACCLLMGKARVIPRSFVSILRLELAAAVLSAKCSKFIKKELQLECTHETFWIERKVVLGYIQSNTKRFKVFVANRIYQIYKSCRLEQWRYVPLKLNPDNHTLRGSGIANVERQTSTWIHGPKFLWQKENTWPRQNS